MCETEGADPELRQGGGLEKQGLQPPWMSHLGSPPALPASARGPRRILFLFTRPQRSLEAPLHPQKATLQAAKMG